MRNAETVLGIIRERGKQEKPLERIYRMLYNPELYLRAYAKLYANNGAMTPGATEETVDGMSMAKIEVLIDDIRHERYHWTPVRRTYVPKKKGGRRPLGMPTWSDKLLQEVIRLILEAYYEPQFSHYSHGFRPMPNRPIIAGAPGFGKCHMTIIYKGEEWILSLSFRVLQDSRFDVACAIVCRSIQEDYPALQPAEPKNTSTSSNLSVLLARGRLAIICGPYGLVLIRESRMAITPRSVSERMSRPTPCFKARLAAGSMYWENGLPPASRTRCSRCWTTGSR